MKTIIALLFLALLGCTNAQQPELHFYKKDIHVGQDISSILPGIFPATGQYA
ncbi:MAG: hypothetical protein M0D57_17990 [Sphingobacteriales bacterium JAD_PAG50586_3]|nr:MAG: hypothetical protein M0D57_17990 [Sphingobacteriales bacterium JAD_PAG50586_3]